MKRILITGKGSYIGTSFIKWVEEKYPGEFEIDELDMRDNAWSKADFSNYNAIFHVAGIAHADTGHISEKQKEIYYKVNTELAINTAQKAKCEGVKQFIFMSSIIVYSGCKEKVITDSTEPNPLNCYGDSKWQAEKKIRELGDEDFKVTILRPPMVYGKNSKGNYPKLEKLAIKSPFFPKVKNKRSMIYLENLCMFIHLMIKNQEAGIFFPQNREYTNTSDMVQMIAIVNGHRIIMIPGVGAIVKLLGNCPGKIGVLVQKVFGDLSYDMEMSEYREEYRLVSLEQSIQLIEANN